MHIISALLQPHAYTHPVTAVQLIETHLSWLLLTGDYAYKIKKNVNLGFVDFSSLAKRQFYCCEELRLNRRLAPDLYIDVVKITAGADGIQMDGNGEVIEYAVKMHQFSNAQLLSNLAMQGQLSAKYIYQLAHTLAEFHGRIAVAPTTTPYGEISDNRHWFDENFDHIRRYLHDGALLAQLQRLQIWGEREIQNKAVLIQQRKTQGFIRECHGDLHLDNITVLNGRVVPFDGLEFNPALRWIDVCNEVAFLLMDLQQRGFSPYAYHFLNTYLTETGDYAALALLRYYIVYRALVRAKVVLLTQPDNVADYQRYSDCAEYFMSPQPAQLIITHGYSGSGKSTFAAQLAQRDGFIHIRSDVERQRLFAQHEKRYSPDKTQQTYQTLAHIAETAIQAGFSVIVDATFLKRAQRAIFQALAKRLAIKFVILVFQTPLAELQRRIVQRQQQANDVSEASVAVLQQQLKTAQELTKQEQRYSVLVQEH